MARWLMIQGQLHRRRGLAAVCCVLVLLSGESVLLAQQAPPATQPAQVPPGPAATSTPAANTAVIPPERLDSLVAPIALYPDPLLAQTLIASTYPLEIVQLKQWLEKNKGLKDKALADAVAKQPWDPAIQSMAAVPDVVKRLADDIQWTTELGNAFLGQQTDVMDAVQRMRQKAKGTGALKSNEQQKVETKVIETQTVIIVEPANPEVIYVPAYSPVVVYGPAFYPYPPIYYPPLPPPGAAFVSFGVGVMVGAAVWGGSCCNTHWGHGYSGGTSVTVNKTNTFVNQSQARGSVSASSSSSSNWQHNPEHRGGTPYPGGKPPSGTGAAGAGARAPSAGQQPAGRSPGSAAGGSSSGGSRSYTGGTGSAGSGFSGGSSGYSGSSAKASSSRGASSMSSGGGASRSGGGGSRGGGGGRR